MPMNNTHTHHKVWRTFSVLLWQHVELSQQIHFWETLHGVWTFHNQPANKLSSQLSKRTYCYGIGLRFRGCGLPTSGLVIPVACKTCCPRGSLLVPGTARLVLELGCQVLANWLNEMASFVCNFCLSVAAYNFVKEIHPWDVLPVLLDQM